MPVPKEVEIHIRVNAIVTTSNIAGIGIIAAALYIGIIEHPTYIVHCTDFDPKPTPDENYRTTLPPLFAL